MKKIVLCIYLLLAFLLASCNDAVTSPSESVVSDACTSHEEVSSFVSEDSSSSENSFTVNIPSGEESETDHLPGDITGGEQLEGKFGEYCFAEEKDGLKILTIYSMDQINALKVQHESKEGLVLTSEEVQYLIDDTLKLFEKYDLIHVRDLDGRVHSCFGLPFFGTEAYEDCFNGYASKYKDMSFRTCWTLVEIIYTRISVLHTASFYKNRTGDNFIVLAGSGPLSAEKEQSIRDLHHQLALGGNSNKFADMPYDLYYFSIRGIGRIECYIDISHADAKNSRQILEGDFGYPQLGAVSYDLLEKNVVVELWEEENRSLVARFRFDESSAPEVIAELSERASQVGIAPSTELAPPILNYRVAVYFNGFVCTTHYFEDFAFKYYPEGNINDFALIIGMPVYWEREDGTQELGISGCKVLTEYINELLMEYLNGD